MYKSNIRLLSPDKNRIYLIHDTSPIFLHYKDAIRTTWDLSISQNLKTSSFEKFSLRNILRVMLAHNSIELITIVKYMLSEHVTFGNIVIRRCNF